MVEIWNISLNLPTKLPSLNRGRRQPTTLRLQSCYSTDTHTHSNHLLQSLLLSLTKGSEFHHHAALRLPLISFVIIDSSGHSRWTILTHIHISDTAVLILVLISNLMQIQKTIPLAIAASEKVLIAPLPSLKMSAHCWLLMYSLGHMCIAKYIVAFTLIRWLPGTFNSCLPSVISLVLATQTHLNPKWWTSSHLRIHLETLLQESKCATTSWDTKYISYCIRPDISWLWHVLVCKCDVNSDIQNFGNSDLPLQHRNAFEDHLFSRKSASWKGSNRGYNNASGRWFTKKQRGLACESVSTETPRLDHS